MPVTIRVVPLPHFEGLALPAYETADAAGMDVELAGDGLALRGLVFGKIERQEDIHGEDVGIGGFFHGDITRDRPGTGSR